MEICDRIDIPVAATFYASLWSVVFKLWLRMWSYLSRSVVSKGPFSVACKWYDEFYLLASLDESAGHAALTCSLMQEQQQWQAQGLYFDSIQQTKAGRF